MTRETPPPNAARHPDQHQPVSTEHTPREREQLELAGVSRILDDEQIDRIAPTTTFPLNDT